MDPGVLNGGGNFFKQLWIKSGGGGGGPWRSIQKSYFPQKEDLLTPYLLPCDPDPRSSLLYKCLYFPCDIVSIIKVECVNVIFRTEMQKAGEQEET